MTDVTEEMVTWSVGNLLKRSAVISHGRTLNRDIHKSGRISAGKADSDKSNDLQECDSDQLRVLFSQIL
jgi:hypothetical protein